jgi:hypothetical protein
MLTPEEQFKLTSMLVDALDLFRKFALLGLEIEQFVDRSKPMLEAIKDRLDKEAQHE